MPNRQDDERHSPLERSHFEAQIKMARVTPLLTILALIVSSVTVVIALFALSASEQAATATSEQAVIASQTEERQLRAYVFTNVTSPVPSFDPDIENYFSVRFVNGGSTPAYSPAGTLHWQFVPVSDMDNVVEAASGSHSEHSTEYLFKDHVMLSHSNTPLILTPDQSAAVRNGTGGIAFWGELRYNDAFQCHRYTNFCVWYTVRDGQPAGFHCAAHNDVDDPTICSHS